MTRVEEYLFFVYLGTAAAQGWTTNLLTDDSVDTEPAMPTVWFSAIRVGSRKALRSYYAETTLFYPVLIDSHAGSFHSVGRPLKAGERMEDYPLPEGTVAIWPLSQGREQTWRFTGDKMAEFFAAGYARLGRRDPVTGTRPITYLRPGTQAAIDAGDFVITGRSPEGAVELALATTIVREKPPATVWNRSSHYARDHGSKLLARFVPGRDFPFPKSLFAVEDALRTAVKHKPQAVVLDFFAGSGTTAHAIMRLNKQDGGRRQCLSVTNNEVGVDEQKELVQKGLRPGDEEWEALGICEHITKPRITAAITGRTHRGEPIKGDYRYTDEFPMADGFAANARFFTLTYEREDMVSYNLAFARIAPLLWLRAGSVGRVITEIPSRGWDVATSYAVLFDLDAEEDFIEAVRTSSTVGTVFIVTSDAYAFQRVAARFPAMVDKVHLYRSYLSNFAITTSE